MSQRKKHARKDYSADQTKGSIMCNLEKRAYPTASRPSSSTSNRYAQPTEVLQLCSRPRGRLAGCSSWHLRFVVYFKWRQFEPEVILLAVGWYLRFSLSYRDVEELLTERGLQITSWCGDRSSGMRPNCRAARRTKSRLRGRAHDPQKARRAKVKWVRRSVCSIALLLVCLDWESDSLELSHPPPVRFQSCNTTRVE
jgi:hypothetical protein